MNEVLFAEDFLQAKTDMEPSFKNLSYFCHTFVIFFGYHIRNKKTGR